MKHATAIDTTSEMMMAKSMAEGQPWSKAVQYDRGMATQSVTATVPWIAITQKQIPNPCKMCYCKDPSGDVNYLWDMGWNNLQAGFEALGRSIRLYLPMNMVLMQRNLVDDPDYSSYLVVLLMVPMITQCAFWPALEVRGYLHAAYTFSIFASNVNVIGEDMWTFTAPAVETTDANKAEDFDMMNVYPNPYYGTTLKNKIVLITL